MSRKKKDLPQIAFCPDHGKLDEVDYDGCCPSCGASSMGPEFDKHWAEYESLKKKLIEAEANVNIMRTVLEEAKKRARLNGGFAVEIIDAALSHKDKKVHTPKLCFSMFREACCTLEFGHQGQHSAPHKGLVW